MVPKSDILGIFATICCYILLSVIAKIPKVKNKTLKSCVANDANSWCRKNCAKHRVKRIVAIIIFIVLVVVVVIIIIRVINKSESTVPVWI